MLGRGCTKAATKCTHGEGLWGSEEAGAGRAILALAERRPLGFAIGYGGLKTIAADALVQRYMEDNEELDKRRMAVFLSFGFFQVGFVQYQLYVNAFTRLFPTAARGQQS